MNVIISGSIAYDFIMDFGGEFTDHILPDQIHKLNISFVIDKLQRYYGGCAGNIAYSLSLLNTPVKVIGIAGNDFEVYGKHFASLDGIDYKQVKIDKQNLTACAYINSDRKSNQITAYYPGASKNPYQHEVKNLDLNAVEWALVGPENKQSMLNNLDSFSKAGLKVVFDSGQMTPYFTKNEWEEIFEKINFLIVNDYEIELIQKNSGVKLQQLRKMLDTIIVTLGEKGSVIYKAGEEIKVPVVKAAEIVDPTGAGDAYRAGLLAGLARDYSVEMSAKMGSLAAVYAIEKRGTQVHRFSLEEFTKKFKKNFNETIKLTN